MIPTIFIHGIQNEKETLGNLKGFMESFKNPNFHFFDWSEILSPFQKLLYDRIKNHGNYLCRQINHAICFLGTDMWWLLQGMKDGSGSDKYRRLMSKLESEIKSIGNGNKLCLITHSWGTWVGLQYIVAHPEIEFTFVTMGSPLVYGSGAFDDWGSPSKLNNIKKWVNIWTENDSISKPFSDNPNKEWSNFVQDIQVNSWTPFPIQAHSSYFKSKKTKETIDNILKDL